MTKHADPVSKSKSNVLQIAAQPDVDTAAVLAQTALLPSLKAACTIQQWRPEVGETDLTKLVDELKAQSELVNGGDLSRAEAMLTAQAHTLDAIFNNLARRAAVNAGEYLKACETYTRLALKAQSQCRATLETLAAIKNPQPVTFVKQANVAHGPQQVNNGRMQPGEGSRARKSENAQNKLLERNDGERLDNGTAQASVGAGPSLETVGTKYRTADDHWQTARSTECP